MGREEERAVNILLWCALNPHKMASNHNRDIFRSKEVFSVWFTLKPSLIPVWWLPWVFAAPRPHPNRINTIKFLGTIRIATSQLPNHGQRKREGKKKKKNYLRELRLLEFHILGQSSLSKPVPPCSQEIIKRSVDEGGSERGKQREKIYISQCAF